MTRSRADNVCASFVYALQRIVQRSVRLLVLRGPLTVSRRMSWAFGIKPRQAAPQNGKGQESSERAIDKLQGYHQLAKVTTLLQQQQLAQKCS